MSEWVRSIANSLREFVGNRRHAPRLQTRVPVSVSIFDAKADAVCLVAKSWDYHVRVALETTLDDNLAAIRESVAAAGGSVPLHRLGGQLDDPASRVVSAPRVPQ